jgi:hypothetical protein
MPRPNLALFRRSLATAAAVAVASLSGACDPIGPDAGLTAEGLRLGDIAAAAESGQPVSIANFSDPSLCLTSHSAGAQATVAGCDDSDPQKLIWGDDGAIATSGNLCLEATGGRNGDIVVFKQCGNAAGQMWSAGSNGRIESASGRCLDLDRRGSGSRDVVLWSCSGPRDEQGWGVLEGRVVLSASEVELTALEETTTIKATIIVDGSEVEQSVGWMTEDREVVEVSADGTLTARSPGSTYVVAHADCCPEAKVKVSVRQVVAAVAVTAGALTLQVGEETSAIGTARDANGHEVPGVTFEWRSSDAGVAAVDGNGKVMGLNAGEASILASADEAQGNVGLAVVGASDGGTSTSSGTRFPNEPEGYDIEISDRPFHALNEGGWEDRPTSGVSIVEDQTAPHSSPYVGQKLFKEGDAGGWGVASQLDVRPHGVDRVYGASWIKISDNWVNHPGSNLTKTHYLWIAGSSRVIFRVIDGRELDQDLRLNAMVRHGPENRSLGINVDGGFRFKRGEWVLLEWEAATNTTFDSYDGEIRAWINGHLVLDHRDVGILRESEAGEAWQTVEWNTIWGGGASHSVPYDMYWWFDNQYVSGTQHTN